MKSIKERRPQKNLFKLTLPKIEIDPLPPPSKVGKFFKTAISTDPMNILTMTFGNARLNCCCFFKYGVLPKGKVDLTALKFRRHCGIVHWSGHLAPWSILRHGTRSSPRPPQATTRSPHPTPSSDPPPSPPHPALGALFDPRIHCRSTTTGGDRKLSRSSDTLWSSSW